jgi:hypothetical protein
MRDEMSLEADHDARRLKQFPSPSGTALPNVDE